MASYGCWAARRRVPLHFLLAAVVLLFARPVPELLGAGAILVAAGVAVRAWAAGHLRREGAVTVTGPYAHLRHPLYLGTAFILAGFAVAAGRAGLAALVGLYFVALFVPVMRREERERRAAASELYSAYASRVPAFLPRLRPARVSEPTGPGGTRFDPQLYLHNREWRSVLGCAALLAILYGKMIWAG
ncbi:MAG: isoprenylcysteine carboxylmethyltransferase family protein [Candidatus Acidiferrales bacterium]